MDTNAAFELLRPDMERLIRDAPVEVKTTYIPIEGGEFIHAAFRSIQLVPLSDALMKVAEEKKIDITIELEKKLKENFRAFRLQLGLISEYEWNWLERWEVPPNRRKGMRFLVYHFQAPTIWSHAYDRETKSHWLPVMKESDIKFVLTEEVLRF